MAGLFDNVNQSLFQGGLGLLAGGMPNSGINPYAAGLSGLQTGMAMDKERERAAAWQAFINGQGMGQPTIPNPASMTAGIPPINQAGGPVPQAPGGPPSSASLRQRFAAPQQAMPQPAGAPPAALQQFAQGQGLGSERWREFGLPRPQGGPQMPQGGATAGVGPPPGVQTASLGPLPGGGPAMGTGGGAVTLAPLPGAQQPQAQPQQALGASPGPGTGLQGLIQSLDPQTRQMVAMLGPERGAPLLMSMLQGRKPAAPTETQKRQNLASAAGLQPGSSEYNDFMLRGAPEPAPKAASLPDIARLQQYRASLPAGPQRDQVDARIAKLNAPSKGQNITVDAGGNKVPPAPTDMAWVYENGRRKLDERGVPIAMPIQGTKLWQEQQDVAAEAAAAQAREGTQLQTDVAKAETMLDATSGIRAEFEGANTPVTGTGSIPFAQFSGTPAGRVRSYVNTLQSGSVLGAMQELKKASSSGATGFGALNEKELDLLIASVGALNPTTTEEDIFLDTVDRIEGQYGRVIADIKANVSPERIKDLGLEELIAKAEFGIRPEDTPENQALIANVPPANERNIGTWYQTPRGRALWTGEGWRLE